MNLRQILIATATAVAFGSTASAEILRFSSFEPPVAHVTKNILTPWAAKVNAASDGELDIQIFPGGTLGRNPAQQVQQIFDMVADKLGVSVAGGAKVLDALNTLIKAADELQTVDPDDELSL